MEVLIHADQDISAATGPQVENVVPAAEYLSGSVVRGAFAAAWIRRFGLPTSADGLRRDFVALFESGAVRYGPALPDGHAFAPLYMKFCKYRGTTECASVAIDTSLPEARSPKECPICGGSLAYGKGSLVRVDLQASRPRARTRTRVELSRGGTAADGVLFSREAISHGAVLRGRIDIHPSAADLFDQSFSNGDALWLGGTRSIAGRATVKFSRSAPSAPAAREDGLVLLRFESPAILVDEFGRNTPEVSAGTIARALGVQGPVRVVQQWLRHDTVGGWHAASGLPKPTEWAVVAGAAVLVDLGPEGADLARLAESAHQGVGLRRVEGFGMISVNPEAVKPVASSPGSAASAGARGWRFEALLEEEAADRRWLSELAADRFALIEAGNGREERLESEFEQQRFWRLRNQDLAREALSGTAEDLQLLIHRLKQTRRSR